MPIPHTLPCNNCGIPVALSGKYPAVGAVCGPSCTPDNPRLRPGTTEVYWFDNYSLDLTKEERLWLISYKDRYSERLTRAFLEIYREDNKKVKTE